MFTRVAFIYVSVAEKDICFSIYMQTFTHICIFTCVKTYACAYVNINVEGESLYFVHGNKYLLNEK